MSRLPFHSRSLQRAALGWLAGWVLVASVAAGETARAEATAEALATTYSERIVPLLKTHCWQCHDAATAEAMLDLSGFGNIQDVTAAHLVWETILERVEAGEMPPADASPSLAAGDRQTLLEWIGAVRRFEAERQAGDPGPTLARRLSNAEYDHSIRDLTGIDIRPTATFPVDPANEAGFDNSGESLAMSPALMKKYLEAARTVAEHLVFTPAGLRFAPHPVVTDTDRDKYCVKRIVAFYRQQPTDYADYFQAAWEYRHRQALGRATATLATTAERRGISPKYLQTIWQSLHDEDVAWGPLAHLQTVWRELPGPGEADEVAAACQALRDYVLAARERMTPHFDNLHIDEIHKGSQPFVLWKNKQYANHRRQADFRFLETLSAAPETPAPENPAAESTATDAAMPLPGFTPPAPDEVATFKADCQTFAAVYPDAFYISERGRDYLGRPKAQQEKGRLLSAGFHSMMGYFRDDQPLYELILDEAGQAKLDALWRELDFFTAAPLRQYQGFLWFERTDSRYLRDPQFDFARPEDKAALRESMIVALSELYLAKAKANGGTPVPLQAIADYFDEINAQIRWVETTRLAAEPNHLDAVIALAERAYRRPLEPAEAEDLRRFYRGLRDREERNHEEAIQDTLVSVLMSPHFCYRLDLLSDTDALRPLDDYELASRLSYFLWASLPDAELREVAAAGKLRDPQVLQQQTQRMLQDRRVRGLATEFAANWLDVRRFEHHNSVDRERFPSFDDALRSAMFEEPIRFFLDVVQNDRSLLDFLEAKHTFVNKTLAAHYGMPEQGRDGDDWWRVENARPYGRGGLLPMAVFLTKNSPGLRTSPVKRGYWVVRRLLGERIPPPPPNVPDLPEDESALGELTLRETLAKHRAHASCAGCHDRFDSLGLVFEGFGPIGERRQRDLGGRAIDASATFPDGSERDGVAELRQYLREARQVDFVDNLCRKLLSYGLGRSLQLSDEPLLETMRTEAAADGYRFGQLIETIVTSPQFLSKRGRRAATSESVATRESPR